MATGKGLFEFMRTPHVFGGPDINKDIIVRNNMNGRYSQYFQTHENIAFEIFYDEKREVYLYHFQIEPSDDKIDIFYDILIEFSTKDPIIARDGTLQNYDVRFFSNSPGFAFPYAYVFNKKKLLISSLKDKYEGYLDDEPIKSNPKLALGYDYTLYICMRYLYLNNYLINKNEIKIKGKPLNRFRPQDIITAREALYSRNGTDKNAFKKLTAETKRTLRKVASPVRNAISNIGKRVDSIISKTQVIKPKKGYVSGVKKVKTVKSSKIVTPRKKR